jgi:hypothetical protein
MLNLLYFTGVVWYPDPMLRSARIDASGVLHHIIGRGIERRDVFLGDADRDDFKELVRYIHLPRSPL